MNERIQELHEEAMKSCDEYRSDILNYHRIYREKFARLIVRECMNAVMDGTAEGDLYVMRIDNHFFDNGTGGILHFGVEE